MQIDVALEFDTFPAGRPLRIYLMVLIKAESVVGEARRRPLNLSLVVDRSGSMAGPKIDYTRRAAQMLVQNLGASDTLSVVLYNDTVETLLNPEKVQRKDIINQQISRITPSGATNLSGGWLQGVNFVAQNLDKAQTNRVILISDGLANRGVTEASKLVTFATQKYGEGVSTTTMGLGDDFNEELLISLANAGGGAYYYIESPEVMPTILNEELTGLLKMVGQNMTIHVGGVPSGSVRQMNAYTEEPGSTGKTFHLGDVFGDEIKALVLELELPGFEQAGAQRAAMLTMTYDKLTDSGVTREKIEREITITIDANALAAGRKSNTQVVEQVMLLKAAHARRQAVDLADHGKFSEASQVLEAVIAEIDESSVADASLLEDEKKSLSEQAKEMSQSSQTDMNVPAFSRRRKTLSSQAYYTMTSRHNETVVMRQRMNTPEESSPAKNPKEIDTKPQRGSPRFAHYSGRDYPIEGDEVHFGRAVENTIVVDERGVSRFHCVLRRDGEIYWLEDTGSTNGTVINGTSLSGRHPIRAGDIIHLGEAKIVFHDGTTEQL
ncbi:MAG: FHA domain-containing protein [Chloroflexi bacterium]|nr:FHA domain-containing protein [Chloroflexota bacterium]